MTEEDEIYSLAAMPGWLYLDPEDGDIGVTILRYSTVQYSTVQYSTILRIEQESQAFVLAGQWTQAGGPVFFNTSL